MAIEEPFCNNTHKKMAFTTEICLYEYFAKILIMVIYTIFFIKKSSTVYERRKIHVMNDDVQIKQVVQRLQ